MNTSSTAGGFRSELLAFQPQKGMEAGLGKRALERGVELCKKLRKATKIEYGGGPENIQPPTIASRTSRASYPTRRGSAGPAAHELWSAS